MFNLKEVIFSITNRCNLRCKMCDIPYVAIDELSTDQWKNVIKDASRLGAQTIVFSGGEPLLRKDIFELISFAKKNCLSACLTSNGQFIDEQVALELSSSGVNVVNISIEGTKETHDFLRGIGSFDKAVLALANLKKYNVESTVASTVSKYNYADLLHVLDVAKKYKATTVRLQPFNTIFLKDNMRQSEFLIDKRDIRKIGEIITKFVGISKEYNIATNPVNYLSKIPEYLTGKKIFMHNCGALWYSCPINANGDVFPCWAEGAHNRLVGNVRQESLYGLWLSEKRIKMVNLIINNGCTGCLMSCYDEVFNPGSFNKDIFHKIRKIRKLADYRKVINRVGQFLKSQITKFKLRYKFYASYRGSLAVVIKRRFASFLDKSRHLRKNNHKEKTIILQEINQVKNKLIKEMHSL